MFSDLPKILKFDSSDDISSLSIRWTRWLQSFELYATGQGVKDAEQKKGCCYIELVFQYWTYSTQRQ